ncbi:FMNH2-utilizing oxygenase [Brevibacterium sediminis]|uniref:FMNH2-utilizing oxygenase n=2 Tax=Brevibacterium sediminis TaxID=1857024 RepID=A0ABQ1M5A8_9MICO|nr:LLM class flavin-dependent oxidoreductase [Brevibacterium sediminis]GGC34633.1 FMNH2-utilizing oxygenase [Brevibacterium sediminis]
MADHRIIVAAALDGAGWHPAAWREPSSQPDRLYSPDYWLDRVREAEEGGLDFVTFEDNFALQSSDRRGPDTATDEVRGRLDARLIASRVAPVTDHIGLIPVVNTTLTEPFHVSKAIATLDFTSSGRAGVQARVASRAEEYSHIGRHDAPTVDSSSSGPAELSVTEVGAKFEQAAEEVDAIRRLWDSWEDDAEIRDVATDRFIDADKLHTIDFEASTFSIRGPSITPRSPQGQPVVAALAHAGTPYRFAARATDLVFVTPTADNAAEILSAVRTAEAEVRREGDELKVIADLVVLLDASDSNGTEVGGADPNSTGPDESAAVRLERLDSLGRPLAEATEARIVVGSASEVADVVEELAAAGYDGVRLRPGVLTDDLPLIANQLAPELRDRGLTRSTYPQDASLRELVGLPAAPPSRYAGETGQNSPAPASAL